jgi:hypothetical protein
MARKKRHAKHRRRHHRRVGALALNPSSPLVMLGSVAIGYFGAGAINPMVNMLIPATMKTQPMTGKLVAAGEVGIGALLILGKGKKSMIKTIAGGLLAGAGLKRAMVVFAPGATDTLGAYRPNSALNGYGDVPVIGKHRMNGYGDVPVIGRTPGVSHGTNGVYGYIPNSQLHGVMGNVDPGCMG